MGCNPDTLGVQVHPRLPKVLFQNTPKIGCWRNGGSREQTAFLEYLSLVCSPYLEAHKLSVNFSSWGLDTLFWLTRHQACTQGTYIRTCSKHPYTKFKKKEKQV